MSFEKLFDSFVRATEPDDRKLYLGSVLYSLFHLGIMWYVYLVQKHAAPYAFVIVHMVFVGVLYTLPKEIQRWHNGSKPSSAKAGHLLVLLWLLCFATMGIGQTFTDGDYRLPEGMTEMICFLILTLAASHISKRKHELKHPPCPEETPILETKTPT